MSKYNHLALSKQCATSKSLPVCMWLKALGATVLHWFALLLHSKKLPSLDLHVDWALPLEFT